jgi:hypothetical protein
MMDVQVLLRASEGVVRHVREPRRVRLAGGLRVERDGMGGPRRIQGITSLAKAGRPSSVAKANRIDEPILMDLVSTCSARGRLVRTDDVPRLSTRVATRVPAGVDRRGVAGCGVWRGPQRQRAHRHAQPDRPPRGVSAGGRSGHQGGWGVGLLCIEPGITRRRSGFH